MKPQNLRRRRVVVAAIVTGAVLVPLVGLGGLGYATSVGLGTARADEYSTTTGSTTTSSAASAFQAVSGALAFASGVNTKTITVAVVGDRTRERNETFSVNLSNPSANAYIGDGQGLGTIVDDD